MDRNDELINKRYDALMFARTNEESKRAAKLLVDVVLGEEGLAMPLERAMREVCRKLRPASDPRDQARFEAEFLELVFAPATGISSSVLTDDSQSPHNQSRQNQVRHSKAA